MSFNEEYWDNRYKNNEIGWDLGEVSPPIKTYIDQLTDKSIRVLIPGGGNSYEAEYLFKLGFKNVYVVDLSKTALKTIKSRVPNFPSEQLLHKNFFDLDLKFDLVLEQTFFCAIEPGLRMDYVTKMHKLLSQEGKLVGVLFNSPLNDDRPPFGGHKEEYIKYFNNMFLIKLMEPSYNSISSRIGKELFFKLIKVNS